jgi:hypothetical protein
MTTALFVVIIIAGIVSLLGWIVMGVSDRWR